MKINLTVLLLSISILAFDQKIDTNYIKSQIENKCFSDALKTFEKLKILYILKIFL